MNSFHFIEKLYHENTKWEKHERKKFVLSIFRVFVINPFYYGICGLGDGSEFPNS